MMKRHCPASCPVLFACLCVFVGCMWPGGCIRRRQGLPSSSHALTHPQMQVRLVLEYADKGTLRDALDAGAFRMPLIPPPPPKRGPSASTLGAAAKAGLGSGCSPTAPTGAGAAAGAGENAASSAAGVEQGGKGERPVSGAGPQSEEAGPAVGAGEGAVDSACSSSAGQGAAGTSGTGAVKAQPSQCPLNYKAILDTAADIAKAMLHLHALNVLHGGGWGRRLTSD